MRLYTRSGDQGDTGLWKGGRVRKDDARIALLGELDELNAHLGLSRADLPEAGKDRLGPTIARCQRILFELGTEVAGSDGEARIRAPAIRELEAEIDRLSQETPPLSRFVLPGGHRAAAHLHLARAVARRAERGLVAFARIRPVNPVSLAFLNRLSDFLFAAARWVNHVEGVSEPTWAGQHADAPPSEDVF